MKARPVAMRRPLRQNVEDLLTRVLAGGETDLVSRLVHPDFVNHEASPERRHGPKGAAATSQWLRSCFGELSYEIHHIFTDDHMTAAYGDDERNPRGWAAAGTSGDAQAVRGQARPPHSLRPGWPSGGAYGGPRRPRHGHATRAAPASGIGASGRVRAGIGSFPTGASGPRRCDHRRAGNLSATASMRRSESAGAMRVRAHGQRADSHGRARVRHRRLVGAQRPPSP